MSQDSVSAHVLGVDIGGSGMKARVVGVDTGELITERTKLPTPSPASPLEVARTLELLLEQADWPGPLGCAFPGVVTQDGVAQTANNLDPSWIGTDVAALFSEVAHRPVHVVNDADAAGLAEARFGAAKGVRGTALILTLGTGVGSCMVSDGWLVPNTELGQVEVAGAVAEKRVSARAKEDLGCEFEEWAQLLDEYLHHLFELVRPEKIVIGGGISRDFDLFGHLLTVPVAVVPAALRNEAGIVGAAVLAVPSLKRNPP